ncbi:hypothetical protein HDK90DRAFT_178379 [Phyllosticta capitalensis]|uniref:Uncharacterized protein n=1 Tax=Phyllosticta capitalensis TaxID=121624 RepID=A0ABR1YWZ5_9PEZI
MATPEFKLLGMCRYELKRPSPTRRSWCAIPLVITHLLLSTFAQPGQAVMVRAGKIMMGLATVLLGFLVRIAKFLFPSKCLDLNEMSLLASCRSRSACHVCCPGRMWGFGFGCQGCQPEFRIDKIAKTRQRDVP